MALYVDGDSDSVFNEALLPLVEAEERSLVTINLPNGIAEFTQKNYNVIYELCELQDLSPRFISALQLVFTKKDPITLQSILF